MPTGPTRKFDYEKGKRRDAVANPDHVERFKEEGDGFDRGGKEQTKLITFKGNSVYIDRRSFVLDDKRSVIKTLESHPFTIEGRTGTIGRLKKDPKAAERVADLWGMTCKSILLADTIVRSATHPTKKREYGVVEFKCFIKPAKPLPDPIFKDLYAFSAKLVGQAITGD